MMPASPPPIPMLVPLWAQDSQSPLLSLMLLTGVLLILISLVTMLRKRRQRVATQPTAREQLERGREKQRMRGDLDQLMVELEQLTKRFSAQLDAKTLQLEKLIDQADRRIDELKRLQDEAPGLNQAPPPQDAETALRAASIGTPSRTGSQPSTSHSTAAAKTTVAAANGSAFASISDRSAAREKDELVRHVYALADQGLDAGGIAHQLDEHIGKVELMLALRKA